MICRSDMAVYYLQWLILVTVSRAMATGTCWREPFFNENNRLNRRLTNHVLYETQDFSLHGCFRECMFVTACKSINYDYAKKTCELNKINENETNEGDLVDEKGVLFKDISKSLKSLVGGCENHACNKFERCWPLGNDYTCRHYIETTIGKECTVDSDCLETGGTCIENRENKKKCFCGFLYRYNQTVRDCQKVCTQIGSGFERFSGKKIAYYVYNSITMSTLEKCKDKCLSDDRCLSFKYSNTGGQCLLDSVSREMVSDADPQAWKEMSTDDLNRGKRFFNRKCDI